MINENVFFCLYPSGKITPSDGLWCLPSDFDRQQNTPLIIISYKNFRYIFRDKISKFHKFTFLNKFIL